MDRGNSMSLSTGDKDQKAKKVLKTLKTCQLIDEFK